MEQLKSTGQMVGAQALVGVAGFTPPTLHAAAARTANDWSRRMFNLVVTNVPGPQFPLYAAGALMLGAYPVVPLAKGQAVSIGLTSYDGGVYFGLNADRDAMTDVDVLAECLQAALAELLDTVPANRRRARKEPLVSPQVEAAANPRPRKTAARKPKPSKPDEASGTPQAPKVEPTAVRPKQVSSSASRGLVTRPRRASTPRPEQGQAPA
jgi:hypothetical protein